MSYVQDDNASNSINGLAISIPRRFVVAITTVLFTFSVVLYRPITSNTIQIKYAPPPKMKGENQYYINFINYENRENCRLNNTKYDYFQQAKIYISKDDFFSILVEYNNCILI